jgi:hypothetical protein
MSRLGFLLLALSACEDQVVAPRVSSAPAVSASASFPQPSAPCVALCQKSAAGALCGDADVEEPSYTNIDLMCAQTRRCVDRCERSR